MSGPFVSVVVPTFNRAALVEPAIDSILSQDYEALEVIALDDGSSDETPAVLARIAQRTDPARFSWEKHENMGQAATINRGLQLARGDLLGYLSSDDALLPGAIRRLVEVAERHPEADVFYPWFQVIDAQDRLLDTIYVEEHTFVEAMRWAVCQPGVGALVRRRLYERIGGWDSSYRYCPDFEWWLRAGDAKFVRVPQALGLWRAHEGSITMTQLDLESVRERLRLLDEVYDRDDLPEAVRQVQREAYAATLVQSATVLDRNIGGPESRFVVEDRLGPRLSGSQREVRETHGLQLEGIVREQARRIELLTDAADEHRGTIAAIQETLGRRAARVDELESQLAAAEGQLASCREQLRQLGRPLWLKLARRLTPPGLRPSVGATVHRMRGRVG